MVSACTVRLDCKSLVGCDMAEYAHLDLRIFYTITELKEAKLGDNDAVCGFAQWEKLCSLRTRTVFVCADWFFSHMKAQLTIKLAG